MFAQTVSSSSSEDSATGWGSGGVGCVGGDEPFWAEGRWLEISSDSWMARASAASSDSEPFAHS